MVPAAAVDKNAGDRRSVAAGRRGSDERVSTSLWMSSGCSRGQLARAGGLGGAVHGRACCGRPLAAVADLMAALWGSRGGSAVREGAGVLAAGGQGPERARGGRQCDAAARCGRVQNVRSGRAQSTHARCSTKCHRVLEGLSEAGS